MADCKACGAWFETTTPRDLCPTCERALKRLNGYVVPVVRGRWVDKGHGLVYACSECGNLEDVRLSKFCPDCGADMRVKTAENSQATRKDGDD